MLRVAARSLLCVSRIISMASDFTRIADIACHPLLYMSFQASGRWSLGNADEHTYDLKNSGCNSRSCIQQCKTLSTIRSYCTTLDPPSMLWPYVVQEVKAVPYYECAPTPNLPDTSQVLHTPPCSLARCSAVIPSASFKERISSFPA